MKTEKIKEMNQTIIALEVRQECALSFIQGVQKELLTIGQLLTTLRNDYEAIKRKSE